MAGRSKCKSDSDYLCDSTLVMVYFKECLQSPKMVVASYELCGKLFKGWIFCTQYQLYSKLGGFTHIHTGRRSATAIKLKVYSPLEILKCGQQSSHHISMMYTYSQIGQGSSKISAIKLTIV